MATHKSAEKRNRQNERRRKKNVAIKSRVKTQIKSVIAAVDAKNPSESQEKMDAAAKIIAKAASKGILHKNNAARKISRLSRKVNALSSEAAE